MVSSFIGLLRDEQGPTAVEYAFMIAGVAAIILGIVFVFGAQVKNLFLNTTDKLP